MQIRLVNETYQHGKVVLGFFVLGQPLVFLTRYVREKFEARLVEIRKNGEWYIIDIEYPPAVAKIVVEELRRPGRSDFRKTRS